MDEGPPFWLFVCVALGLLAICGGAGWYDQNYNSISAESYNKLVDRFPERKDELTRRFFDKFDRYINNDEQISRAEYSSLIVELDRIDDVNANNRLRYKYMNFKDQQDER